MTINRLNGVLMDTIFFLVCPAWATTWRWKSVTGLIVGTVS